MTETAVRAGPIRVSELNRYVKYLLDGDELLKALAVEGEISEISRSPAGHVYFNLKDASSQVGCVLYRKEAAQQREEVQGLRRGVDVVVHGSLTVYEGRGTYQVYVQRVLVQGEGAHFRRFQALKVKLEREGLFSEDRKRPLPMPPRKLALITSPNGQAYHDVLRCLRTNYPLVEVVEVGVSVQGSNSADEVILAMDIVNRLTDVDVILLVRGGGDPEDLASFNDERLARAVYASRIPVVTGIGHERDECIVDFVADHRAATPSLAAAAAVPDVSAIRDHVVQLHVVMNRAIAQTVAIRRERWLRDNRALLAVSPENLLRAQRKRADDLGVLAQRAVAVRLRTARKDLSSLTAQLQALDPLAILSRGYAVLTETETGRVVSSPSSVVPGQSLQAQVAGGIFRVKVERI